MSYLIYSFISEKEEEKVLITDINNTDIYETNANGEIIFDELEDKNIDSVYMTKTTKSLPENVKYIIYIIIYRNNKMSKLQ
jgi:hypothetical protein